MKPDAGWGLLLGAGEGGESAQAEERPGSEAGRAEAPGRQGSRSEGGMMPDVGRGPL